MPITMPCATEIDYTLLACIGGGVAPPEVCFLPHNFVDLFVGHVVVVMVGPLALPKDRPPELVTTSRGATRVEKIAFKC